LSVLTAVQQASTVIGITVPSVVFSSTERTMVEMQALVNSCARQILEEYDWSRLKKIATVTGDGVDTAFPLPADYDRMVKDANLWGTSFTYYPSQQLADANQWLELLSYEIQPWEPRWSLFGGNLNIVPALGNTLELKFFYISNWIANGSQSEFTNDTDTFTLDERLLRLSIIWNWKKNKGVDYTADLAEYEEALGKATFKDTGSRQSIISGRRGYWPTGQSFP